MIIILLFIHNYQVATVKLDEVTLSGTQVMELDSDDSMVIKSTTEEESCRCLNIPKDDMHVHVQGNVTLVAVIEAREGRCRLVQYTLSIIQMVSNHQHCNFISSFSKKITDIDSIVACLRSL